MEHKHWNGFVPGAWQNEINVRDFIQKNYHEYTGSADFLSGATPRTDALMKRVQSLFAIERQFGGVLDIDTATVSSLTSYSPRLYRSGQRADRRHADEPPAQARRESLRRHAHGASGLRGLRL